LSRVARVLLAVMWLFLIVSLFLTLGHVVTLLLYMYFFSYVKLAITLIKYIPQVCNGL